MPVPKRPIATPGARATPRAACHTLTLSPSHLLTPTPPPWQSGTSGDRRKQWIMDNGQWTMSRKRQLSIINYALSIAAPPLPPLVAFGCIRDALRESGDRCAGREEKGEHEAETFCHPVTLSPSHLVTPPPLRGIRGHSGTGSKPGSGGDGEKMPAQIGLGRAKFQLLRAKFQLFRDIWGTFWTRCLA